MMQIEKLFEHLLESKGSDLHLKVGKPPVIRQKGELVLTDFPELSEKDVDSIVESLLSEDQINRFRKEKEIDFSYDYKGSFRFRGNLFFQKGKIGGVFRAVPREIPTIEGMGYPEIIREFTENKEGMVLITGPTGSGKSTTLAALIQHINEGQSKHIITIEDPMEFMFEDKKCTINQREIGADTLTFYQALRRALRQDPDVIMVGEMRDPETITIAMTAAETGHLVFSTLHTVDTQQTIDRIINSFPPEQHHQIRIHLANTLHAVVSQRLIKRADGSGRVAVMEIMINTPRIKKLIENNQITTIPKTVEDSKSYYHMQSFNQALFDLVQENVITKEEALSNSLNPSDLKIKMQTSTYAPAKGAKGEKEESKEKEEGKKETPAVDEGEPPAEEGEPPADESPPSADEGESSAGLGKQPKTF